MISQLSDWLPKPLKWAIIVKFDQIRKNWWRISCAEILEVGKYFFAASSVKKMSRIEEVSPEKIKRIAWKFTKTDILLGLAGYDLIITNSAYGLVGYIYQLISGVSSKNNLLIIIIINAPHNGMICLKQQYCLSTLHLALAGRKCPCIPCCRWTPKMKVEA